MANKLLPWYRLQRQGCSFVNCFYGEQEEEETSERLGALRIEDKAGDGIAGQQIESECNIRQLGDISVTEIEPQ